jgi:hypothetical protein
VADLYGKIRYYDPQQDGEPFRTGFVARTDC